MLNDQQQESLQRALKADPPDHGLWSGPKVAHWISKQLNQPVNRWVRTLDHLESLLTDRIRALIKTSEIIRSLTGFSWIVSALNATG